MNRIVEKIGEKESKVVFGRVAGAIIMIRNDKNKSIASELEE